MRPNPGPIRLLSYSAALAILVALAAAPLAAQELNPRISLFGGGSFQKADRTFPAAGDTFHTAFAPGGVAGARVTLDVIGHLAVEGSYSYGANNLRVTNLDGIPPLVRGFGVRVHHIDGDVLYFLTGRQSSIRPFAAFGFGIARFSPTDAARSIASTQGFITAPATLTSGNKFAFNYGFGVEKKLVSHFGLRFDLRDHITAPPRLGVPPGPPTPGADFYPVTGIVHDLSLTVGIVLYASR